MLLSNFFANIPIYIINLEDDDLRKNHILEQFKSYTNIIFIKAIDGRDPERFRNNYQISYFDNEDKFSSSLIAVMCSHIKAIYTAYHNNDDYAIIIEDDAWTDLISSCNFTMTDLCQLNDTWDLIQLYYSDVNLILQNYVHFKTHGIGLLPRLTNLSGSCYLINRHGMTTILTNICHYDGLSTFDIKSSIFGPENLLFSNTNCYIVNRPIFYFASDTSAFDNYYEPGIHPDAKQQCQQHHHTIANMLKTLYGV